MKSKIFILIPLLIAIFLPCFFAYASEKPDIYTRSAMDVEDDSAVLRADVNPNGFQTSVFFEFGSYPDNLSIKTPIQTVGSGASRISVLSSRTSLSSDTRYYYRAVAINTNGISYGSTESFRTEEKDSNSSDSTSSDDNCWEPVVRTELPKFITENSASLVGSVDPENESTVSWFEYGESFSLGKKTATRYVSKSSFALDVEESLSGLKSGSLYYYRIVAENSCGRSVGNILVFGTSGNPVSEKTKVLANNPSSQISPNNSIVSSQDISLWQEVRNTSFSNGTESVVLAYSDNIIEFYLYAKNIGNSDLSGVVIKNNLSPLFDFVESTPDIATDSAGNSLVWKIKQLKKEETQVILVKAKVKETSKNIVAYNVFTTELGRVAKNANKTTVIINPDTIVPSLIVPKDTSSNTDTDALVASVNMPFEEWKVLFNIILFILVFVFFSILFLYYKISWR